ncbi:nuclear movement family protein [Cardiosporidium cionae]|uniref:Nuclear migration protein nudC n=1 Tax=Cardiosporidium cionae TaxID=476202 RepID=A0ABQ7JAW6_9APIC|nr:nuclear movement family protein [Cardiosporidium cionae]|eukprot:KAF8821142.1 nuclear movement family protein [Cardiosporidium cionae]
MAQKDLEERYDQLLGSIAQQCEGIDNLLDIFFGFLLRRTDFFTAVDRIEKCEELVLRHMKKFGSLAQEKKMEAILRNRQLDSEREARSRRLKELDEEEFRKKELENTMLSTSADKVEPIEPSTDSIIEESSLKTLAAVDKEAVEKDKIDKNNVELDAEDSDTEESSPPIGNGGKTDKYIWSQTLSSVEVQILVPPGTNSSACDVLISGQKLRVGLKGKPPIIDGVLHSRIKVDDSLWTLEDKKYIQITLDKYDRMAWWSCVIKGDPTINVKKIVPENSKISDLDSETRSTVEKMLYDQRQKAAGLPTSDQKQQSELLEKFKKAHPEMDFSKAKVNWGGGNNNISGFGNQ